MATSGTNASAFIIGSNTCAGATVPAAGTCMFTVAFAPASTGHAQASINVTGAVPAVASVTGTGI